MAQERMPPYRMALRVNIKSAKNIYKSGWIHSPHAFAVMTVDGEQTCTTRAVTHTVDPVWNESFIINVDVSSVITVNIYDQRKFKVTGPSAPLGTAVINLEPHFQKLLRYQRQVIQTELTSQFTSVGGLLTL